MEEYRPTKRLKINYITPTETSSRPSTANFTQSNFQSPNQSPSTAANGTALRSIQQPVVPPLRPRAQIGSGTLNYPTPRRTLQVLEKIPATMEGLSANGAAVPIGSSAPSLATDVDTSDDSLSSQSDKQLYLTDALTGQAFTQSDVKSGTGLAPHPVSNLDSASTRQIVPSGGLRQDHILERTSSVRGPSQLSDLLDQACRFLEELDTGQALPVNRQEKGSLPSYPSKQGVQNHATRPLKELRHVPDGLPNNPPSLDTDVISVLQGITSELATGLNHGHGIAYLHPNTIHYHFLHRQRFVDCLTALTHEAVLKVNTFLNAKDATNLRAIYRYIERRLPPPELPPPTPPPGHMVVRHIMPQQSFQLMVHDDMSVTTPVLPSGGPPLVKLAPKRRRDKLDTREKLSDSILGSASLS